VFAVFGTAVSAIVIGGGIYLLGKVIVIITIVIRIRIVIIIITLLMCQRNVAEGEVPSTNGGHLTFK